jgi:hypothetical protein
MQFARAFGLSALLSALACAAAGCVVRAAPPVVGGYATVYADDVPPNIYSYPHVWYDGGYAYLVGDQWYYPSGGGWVMLRGEPRELYRYRSDYVYGRTYRQAAPPAYGPQGPVRSYPPPAERVR